jgi:hypothetical protein
MATAQVYSGSFGHSGGKISKSRGRTVVKPILKKLHSHHSDRESSLDLDRGWDDQPSPGFAAGPDFGSTYDSDGSSHHYQYQHQYHSSQGGGTGMGTTTAARSARDVSFTLPAAADMAASVLGGGPRSLNNKYSHVRSTSGNSHTSSIATTTSGRNGGTFIHPFQQTPHTSTPPLLSYANSRASFDNGMATGYSPTITEDDDDVDPYSSFHSTSTAPRPAVYQSAFHQHPNHRRPSMASQRTSSLSDATQTVRNPAARSNSGSTRPLPPPSLNQSKSELNPSSLSSLAADSPLSSTTPMVTATTTLSSIQTTNASSSSPSATPLSPLRSSLDMGGFRLRSRSEVDTSTHQEQVREARRKFEAKERAKEEKYAREQLRKQERAESKVAHKQEKSHSRLRKGSSGHGSVSSSTMSSGTDLRISSSSRKHGPGLGLGYAQEKVDFSLPDHEIPLAGGQTAPSRADEVQFKSPKRSKTAKRKTMGVWTAFMLWLRTRLLKMGRQ